MTALTGPGAGSFGRFQILRQLGAGGMGVVYEALDTVRGERVALKTLRHFSPEGLAQFKREFHSLQDLHHPNLVSLGELLGVDDQWCFTMELVEGVSLHDYVGFAPSRDPPPEAATERLDVPGLARESPLAPPAQAAPGRAPTFDEARLRSCLAQLAEALLALHAAGKIHRDIKPPNLLVTVSGRVVVLDFGLVQDAQPRIVDGSRAAVGTVDYMAPEQAGGGSVGEPADWYAVGVLLYEILTGRLPFSGPSADVLERKQRLEPPDPGALAPAAPRALCELAAALLRIDPHLRAGGFDILQVCGASVSPARADALLAGTADTTFIGRAAELGTLRQAFTDMRGDRQVLVLVEGESGIGKTALVQQFCRELEAGSPEVVILRGRCHAQESVPYKAFDGLVDDLASHLRSIPAEELAAVVPRRARLLTQVFPVLGRVPAFAQAPAVVPVVDPQEQRQRMFTALRELLGHLAERRPLVALVDDVQWADPDSFAMLRELVRAPDPPPLLLVATLRTGDAALPEALAQLDAELRRIALAGLSFEEASRLCSLVQGTDERATLESDVVAREAAGHPFFVRELARQHGEALPERLEDALWARIAALEPTTRRLLEVIALLGQPIATEVAMTASLRPDTDERPALVQRLVRLRTAHLIRTSGFAEGSRLEPYHDRVRRAVLEHLSSDARRETHRRLAQAIERAGQAEPEILAVHWRGAGEPLRALAYARDAAAQAEKALAFERAARLHELVLELGIPADEQSGVLAQLGNALAMAGRGPAAARAFLEAASRTSQADGLDLRRRAGEQLLCSGHIDDGLTVLRGVLEALGLRYPETPRRALVALVLHRLRSALRGLGFELRDEHDVSPAELMRIDLCWSVALTLGFVDTVRGAGFQTQHVQMALRCGERYRVIRALLAEAGFVSTSGTAAGERRARALVARAATLVEGASQPHARAHLHSVHAVATYLCGHFQESLRLAEQAESILREQCTGVTWEIDTMVYFRLCGLYFTGRLAELGRLVPRFHAEATDRGDLYAAANLSIGPVALIGLVRGDPEGTILAADRAMAAWSKAGGHLQHFNHLLALVHAHLYAGRGAEALALLEARWGEVESAQLLRIGVVRVWMLDLRARAALALGTPSACARAARDARALAREPSAWARGSAYVIEAQLAAHAGAREGALAALDRALATYAGERLELLAWAAAHRRAELLEGAARATAQAECATYAQREGLLEPERLVSVFAPRPGGGVD